MGCTSTKSRPQVVKITSSNTSINVSNTRMHKRSGSTRFEEIYKLGGNLGDGGSAHVRKCEHYATSDIRAVKIYQKQENMLQQKALLLREFDILKKIMHPCIINIYEHFEDHKNFYMVMEYCKGGEMYEKIGALLNAGEREVAIIMRQILSAVSYMHSKGIVHRDLKPENLLFEEKGNELHLKLVDFGDAVFLDANGKASGVSGTSYYVAPEALSDSYTELVDEWSCGIILYCLMTGSVPFNGDTDAEIEEEVKVGKYTLNVPGLDTASDEIKDLITKFLSPVDQRITAAEALDHPWMKAYYIVDPDQFFLTQAMQNLSRYTKRSMLREAVYHFVVEHNLTRKDMKSIKEAFLYINSSGSGLATREELLQYYKSTLDEGQAEDVVNFIFENLDLENSGELDYMTFARGSTDARRILTLPNLEMALIIFDTQWDGLTTPKDMRRVLASQPSVFIPAWEEPINKIRRTNDNEIDLKELRELLYYKLGCSPK